MLLEEESLKELEEKNRKYVRFVLSDAKRASGLLYQNFGTEKFQIEDSHRLRLFDTSLPVEHINRCFVENGIEIRDVHMCEDTLEDYFKKVTGGVGIA